MLLHRLYDFAFSLWICSVCSYSTIQYACSVLQESKNVSGLPVAAKRIWKHTSAAKHPKNYFGRAPPLFGSKSTISRFGERFRDGQYSLVSFLFAVFLLAVPLLRAKPFVKVGGARAPVPYGVGGDYKKWDFSCRFKTADLLSGGGIEFQFAEIEKAIPRTKFVR